MLRSKYADPATDTFVELTFAYGGKVYTVRRNPEYQRPKTRGEGVTKQLARAELRYPDGRVVDKSRREVNTAIEAIMGINREHTENPVYDRAGRPVTPTVQSAKITLG